ncbi:MAG: MarR family transcriptional regulator [Hyphomicrobiales bacterium]|nr:MarR family transcriptional regulator [Rhodoblastus sp.]MCB9998606.1 MarR family transcriptional regulator [Methylobacteriaceae bacterium]MCC2099623.1 MarR family transcriptional regulator [Hyphomicrobiales bacterium]MCC2103598.1 MarR family transcriptional regulator [Hyphomicrobiales bacterium]MCC2107161.1 MarR family transcriptional regulator [Hyphomicrobiales bacterium]
MDDRTDLSEDRQDEVSTDIQLDLRTWLKLLTCTTLITAELRRQLREQFDFTLPRFDMLAQLDREPGGLVLTELSKRLMVSPGNVTPIMNRLLEEGYITRSTSSLDRRVQIVCLTAEGRKKFRRMAKKHGQWVNAMMGGMELDERRSLSGLLDQLKANLRDSSGVDTK